MPQGATKPDAASITIADNWLYFSRLARRMLANDGEDLAFRLGVTTDKQIAIIEKCDASEPAARLLAAGSRKANFYTAPIEGWGDNRYLVSQDVSERLVLHRDQTAPRRRDERRTESRPQRIQQQIEWNRAYQRDKQAETLQVATRSGQPWDEDEDALLLSLDQPIWQIALDLGRTLESCRSRRKVLLKRQSQRPD